MMLSKIKTYPKKIKKSPSLSIRQIEAYRHQAYIDLYSDDDDFVNAVFNGAGPIIPESSPVENNSWAPKNWQITKLLERLLK